MWGIMSAKRGRGSGRGGSTRSTSAARRRARMREGEEPEGERVRQRGVRRPRRARKEESAGDEIGFRPSARFSFDDAPQFPGTEVLDVIHRQMMCAATERA